jgi:hypothetical protein
MFPARRQLWHLSSRSLAVFALMAAPGCSPNATSETEAKLENGVTLKFIHPYGPGSCEAETTGKGEKDGRTVTTYRCTCSWKGDRPGKVVVLLTQDLRLTVDGRAFGAVRPNDEVVIDATKGGKVFINGEERQPVSAEDKGRP